MASLASQETLKTTHSMYCPFVQYCHYASQTWDYVAFVFTEILWELDWALPRVPSRLGFALLELCHWFQWLHQATQAQSRTERKQVLFHVMDMRNIRLSCLVSITVQASVNFRHSILAARNRDEENCILVLSGWFSFTFCSLPVWAQSCGALWTLLFWAFMKSPSFPMLVQRQTDHTCHCVRYLYPQCYRTWEDCFIQEIYLSFNIQQFSVLFLIWQWHCCFCTVQLLIQ